MKNLKKWCFLSLLLWSFTCFSNFSPCFSQEKVYTLTQTQLETLFKDNRRLSNNMNRLKSLSEEQKMKLKESQKELKDLKEHSENLNKEIVTLNQSLKTQEQLLKETEESLRTVIKEEKKAKREKELWKTVTFIVLVYSLVKE